MTHRQSEEKYMRIKKEQMNVREQVYAGAFREAGR